MVSIMKKSFILALLSVVIAASQEYRTPTNPRYDYTYSSHGEPFAYEIKGGTAIEVSGTAVCEYRLKSGKYFNYTAEEMGVEFGERCPDLGFSFLTMWQPYAKKGRSARWVCAYGWGSHNGYVFRFMARSCPDVIVATSVGAWMEALDFGEGFGPGDFDNVPQVRAWYNLNTLENNPKFAARVKQRARMGLIYKMGDP